MNSSRANAFAHHRVYCGEHAVTSKEFMLYWIRAFLLRARGADACRTRSTYRSTAPTPAKKRSRMSASKPTLPDTRFDKSLTHVAVVNCPQRRCAFCSFKRAWKNVLVFVKVIYLLWADPSVNVWGVVLTCAPNAFISTTPLPHLTTTE